MNVRVFGQPFAVGVESVEVVVNARVVAVPVVTLERACRVDKERR